MTDTGWLFRATWDVDPGTPLHDPLKVSHLCAVAKQDDLDDLIHEAGAELRGPLSWLVRGGQLVAEAAAIPAEVPS